jgi:hypothetical protein
MAKWIHNISQDQKEYQGRFVEAGQFFTIPDNLEFEYRSDVALLTDLLNGIVKMSSDGVNDIPGTGVNHLDFLKGVQQQDSNGRILVRPIAAASGWKAQFQALRISTSTTDGVHNKDKAGNDLGFCTYTMYDASNQVTTDTTQCVKTVITWEPTHDMEIIGGRMFQRTAPTTNMWLYVTAAAHIPVQYGGSVAFAEGGINLYDVGDGGEADFDGRASKYVAYDTTYHSGRFEILLKHDAGVQHIFSILFELFKP